MSGADAFEVRLAKPHEARLAVEIWRETARWLIEIGRPLWTPEQFNEETARTQAAEGGLALGLADGAAQACMSLQTFDPYFWPEHPPGEGLYLHKLAVRRAAAGQGWGGRLLSWAATHAAEAGLKAVRLDCDPRPELMALYERNGFRRVDPEPIRRGGFPFIRYESP